MNCPTCQGPMAVVEYYEVGRVMRRQHECQQPECGYFEGPTCRGHAVFPDFTQISPGMWLRNKPLKPFRAADVDAFGLGL